MRGVLAGAVGVFLSLGAGGAWGQSLTDSATSTITIGRGGDIATFHTVNTSFEWLGIYRRDRDAYQHLILKKTEEGTVSNGAEGTLGSKVRLEVLEVGDNALEPLFVIEDGGEAGHVDSFAWNKAYFTTVRYGCCGALNSEHTYSLENGRLLFTATADPAWFEVPNSGGLVRIAALHTIFSMEDEELFGARPDALAILSYAAPDQPLQRFLVVLNGALADERHDYPEPMLGWAEGDAPPVPDLEVWSFDGQTDIGVIDNLSLWVQVLPEVSFRMPLVAGRLELGQTTLPPGLGLEELPLE